MEKPGATKPVDRFAEALRGFGPIGILAMILILAGNAVIAPLSAVLALLWVWRSETPWLDIGYTRPRNWIVTIAVGVVFGVALKFLMKIIVMPLLGADPINQAYHYLVGNRDAIPGMLYVIIVGAGFGEETVFRGYLFERLGKLFGTRLVAKISIVIITSLLFGLAHYSVQGLAGTQQATIVGLVFGTIFTFTRRIWMLMIAHGCIRSDSPCDHLLEFGIHCGSSSF